jgi:hypothetical protein
MADLAGPPSPESHDHLRGEDDGERQERDGLPLREVVERTKSAGPTAATR